mmetsp:Transcript_11597/g.17024  ORF Transcript_11597/g.17024 Transcript_11597/m.17024 type:complete len:470 (-) Transcript_11597:69-1478(-)|eukprot:CAMPEP_0194210930 /NCGR_PEP_ID=MMETSP0156-20130528/9190_1 /TAXON_ID=33649 /ORGANISM="Thalassionema nitzschioides, Strain L26-B" /LENGTH=469 /DNA_ID=CAMNT_0038938347 /DNA_START=99 /DNA_END=1508 /DNA_ORIENTATION=+
MTSQPNDIEHDKRNTDWSFNNILPSVESVSKALPLSQMVSKRRSSLFNAFQSKFGITDVGNSTESVPGCTEMPITAYGRPVKVVPGRESHTADFEAFHDFLRKMDQIKQANCEKVELATPYEAEEHSSTRFWDFVQSVVEKALPVGFEGDPEGSKAVVHKSRAEYERFHTKLKETEIINPINPVAIAQTADVPLADVISELLYATKSGLVSMQWAPVCERCISPVRTMTWSNYDWGLLKKNPIKPYCQACRFENTIQSMDNVKVFFMLSESVFYTMATNFHCKPNETIVEATEAKIHLPANSTGSGWRISVGCGDDKQYRGPLDPGLYRMHCPIVPTQNYLRVKRKAKETDEPYYLNIKHSALTVRPGDTLKTLTVPHGKVHFQIFPDTYSEWIFWIHEDLDDQEIFGVPANDRGDFLNAYAILEHPTFKVLFEDQIENIVYDAVEKLRSNDECKLREEPVIQQTRNAR